MATRSVGTPRVQAVAPVGVGRGERPSATRAPQRRKARRAALNGLALLRRGALVGLVLGVVALFAAGVVEQRWKESQLQAQVAAEQAELRTLEERQAKLKDELAAASDEAKRAWVEATARRQLNLAYPGETVYLVNWTPPPGGASPAAQAAPEVATKPESTSKWERVWHFLVGE
jgi:cell division protein FtsB